MKLTYWVNKGLKGEKCFVEEFDNRDELLASILVKGMIRNLTCTSTS